MNYNTDNNIEEKNLNPEYRYSSIENSQNKTKKILVISAAIALLLIFMWYNSESGRLTVSRGLTALGKYSLAEDIISKASGDEADAYDDYLKIIIKAEYMHEHPEKDNYDLTEKLRQSIYELTDDKYLLKDYEVNKLETIEQCISDLQYYPTAMNDYFYSAFAIFDRLEYYNQGNSFSPEDELELINSYKTAYDNLTSLYYNNKYAIYHTFRDPFFKYGGNLLESFEDVLDYATEKMEYANEKYPDSSSIYYSAGSLATYSYLDYADEEFITRLNSSIYNAIIEYMHVHIEA